jgi:hypothetical protein
MTEWNLNVNGVVQLSKFHRMKPNGDGSVVIPVKTSGNQKSTPEKVDRGGTEEK